MIIKQTFHEYFSIKKLKAISQWKWYLYFSNISFNFIFKNIFSQYRWVWFSAIFQYLMMDGMDQTKLLIL